MEPAKAPLRYVIYTTAQTVEERFRTVFVEGSGEGPKAAFTRESLGWYVQFTGSWEGLYLGMEKPAFGVGDKVKISFERIIENAIAIEPSE